MIERDYSYNGWAKAFEIFHRYKPEQTFGVSAEHDKVYAGPNPATVSEEDRAELERYGWHPDEDLETFYHNT